MQMQMQEQLTKFQQEMRGQMLELQRTMMSQFNRLLAGELEEVKDSVVHFEKDNEDPVYPSGFTPINVQPDMRPQGAPLTIKSQVKVNFDSSFQKLNNRAVFGIIVRNNRGFVMGSCTYPIENIRDPTITEAYACFHGVAFAEDLGFQYIILEGDSLTIVKKLPKNDDYIDRSVIGGIINEIISKAKNFRSLMYRHIPGEANEAAHTMAVWGRGRDLSTFWVEKTSREDDPFIQKDQRGME
ncbi:hypothetical protein Gotur_021771 [Gossypium turneri]